MGALRRVRLLIALTPVLVCVVPAAGARICTATEPTVFSVTGTTAVLKWTAPGDDGDLGRAAQYDLRFSPHQIQGTDSLGWWTSSGTMRCTGLPSPSNPGTTDSFLVEGLAPGNTYYFVLRTADEVPNWSYFSNIAVVTTGALPDTTIPGDDTPPPPVAGLTALPVSDGISLSWSPCSAPDLAGYLIYRTYSDLEYAIITEVLLHSTSYVDRDVLAGVSYSYSVTAVDYAGNESPLAQAAIATAPSASPAVTRLLAPFPDPCRTEVVLRYEIAEDWTWGTIKIFDIRGGLVRDLSKGRMEGGQYAVIWDLKADSGERVAPGIYFCVLSSPDLNSAKKIAVLK